MIDTLAFISPENAVSTEFSSHAESLVLQGQMRLLKGDSLGLSLFEMASKLEPQNAPLLVLQGAALFEYGCDEGKERTLLAASKKFKAAVLIDPELFDGWHLWGNTLIQLGLIFEENHYFLEAKDKFLKAAALIEQQPLDVQSGFYWDYGILWQQMAHSSQEALDLQLALDAFQKAAMLGGNLSFEFWNDFGSVCLELGKQINETHFFLRAINCFKQSLLITTSLKTSWELLGKAMELLYEQTHDEDHFVQAADCFAAAVRLKPDDTELWLYWAQFLERSARKTQDVKRVRMSIEKCHRAYACDPNHAGILATWASSLALLGELSERLDIINEAQNKISKALDLDDESPEILYAHGLCLNSLGAYYSDVEYYYQAIEKFQHTLSIDRTYYKHWHGIAKSYTAVARIEEDPLSYELAAKFFQKAIALHPCSSYIFDYALVTFELSELSQKKEHLEEAAAYFERALAIQKNALYLHPEWLFYYAATLDRLGDYHEESSYYLRSIEILSHVLMIDPDFPRIHHQLGLAIFHVGELTGESDYFYRASHHFRLAAKQDEENDQIILDWGITLINIADLVHDPVQKDQVYRDAEHKISMAAKLGNTQAFYQLGCLYSLLGHYDQAMNFIEKADQSESLPSVEEIQDDDWLDGLKITSRFQEFLAKLQRRPLKEERGA